jgi:hypothetical protein
MILNCEIRRQFTMLRAYLLRVYKIDYISAYSKTDSKMTLIDGNAKVDANILKGITFERPRITTNYVTGDVLIDSKKKGIQIRFTVPIEILSNQMVLILESRKRETIEKNVDDIYNDIVKFINSFICAPR